mmetsp:Transcript_20430/g.44437  ORF Transcript_20430/g.44437 Transcript_20430/m.44437 type:complete len:371 (+) Transcript_20430:102-1214(+)
MTISSTKHCWVRDLKAWTFLANSRESVRVMGVVTSFGRFSVEDQALLSPLIMRSSISCNVDKEDLSKSNSKPYFMGVNSRESLLPRAKSKTNNAITNNDAAFLSVTIDDGTDSIAFCAPRQMVESPLLASTPTLAIDIGKTYDCILKLRQNSTTKRWFADTLIQVENPIDEHYRWMELGHHNQKSRSYPLSSSSSSSPSLPRIQYSNLCHKSGFPTRRKNASEVYRFIRIHARLQQEQHQEQKSKQIPTRLNNRIVTTQKRNYPRWSGKRHPLRSQKRQQGLQTTNVNKNRMILATRRSVEKFPSTQLNSTPPQQPSVEKPPPVLSLKGLLLKDLAAVLQKTQRDVQEMTEELQLEGKIYQNERGEYLPL